MAIMGYMGIRHDIIIIADNRYPSFLGCCPVDGYAFSDDIVIPNNDPGILPLVSYVLWWRTDCHKRKYSVTLPNFRIPFEYHMWSYDRVAINADVISNNAVWTDCYSGR
jgi:hypothetical protein